MLCAPVSAIWAPGSGPEPLRLGSESRSCALGSGCRVPRVLREGSCPGICSLRLAALRPWFWDPDAGLCSPALGSARLTGEPSLASTSLRPQWSSHPLGIHTEEGARLPIGQIHDALVGSWALLTPASQISELGMGIEDRSWLRAFSKELQPETLPIRPTLSTVILPEHLKACPAVRIENELDRVPASGAHRDPGHGECSGERP